MRRRVGAWALGRALLTAGFVLGPRMTSAQVVSTAQAPTRPSALIRYGKWLALGGAALLGTEAYRTHNDANNAYTALQDRCFSDPHACDLGPGGTYVDPVSEGLYDRSRTLDHQGARLLIGAEALFATSTIGFLWELTHRRDDPKTIPFEPRVETTSSTTRVGLTVRF